MTLLSILIPSIPSRQELRATLVARLEAQIRSMGVPSVAEVIVFEDDKSLSVGAKRNKLLREALGEFVAFVDDDDDVSDDYVSQIFGAVEGSRPAGGVDCIGMRGIITVNGGAPRQVHYSLANKSAFNSEGVYFRSPGHLNPIRRALLAGYAFPEVNVGEDADFSDRLLAARTLKKEAFVDKVLYHYRYSSTGTETQKGVVPGGVMGLDPTVWNVVILSKRPENLRACVRSILENEPIPQSKIAVVDDGAGVECRREFPDLTWLDGKSPFVFARNANHGINSVYGDVILMNDDARLETKFGFSSLSFAARGRKDVGVLAANVVPGGIVHGRHAALPGVRLSKEVVPFVCVYIPRATVARVGHLDERFVGYGWEDNDYCRRIQRSGLAVAYYDACRVLHGDSTNTSTFRSRHDIKTLYATNETLYKEKWAGT
jgi:glycosyltransferase involved in cell wall biosynthesis